MFDKLTIRARLGAAFTLVLGLLIASSCIGVFGLNQMSVTARYAITNDVQLAQRAARIDSLILNERRFEKDGFINIADAQKAASYKKRWDDSKSALLSELSAARTLQLTAEDQRSLDLISASFQSYVVGFEKTVDGIRAGKIRTTQEANSEFTAYKDAVHEMESACEELNQRASDRAKGVIDTLSTTRVRSTTLQISIALCCLLLGLVVCIVTTRSITKPLSRAKGVAESVAAGKLDNKIEVVGRDETAQLLSALVTMQDALRDAAVKAADYEGQIAAIGKAQAVIEFDLDGTVRTANENFLRTMGYSLTDVQGRHHSMFVDPSDRSSPEYRVFWEKLGRGVYDAGQYKRIARGGREIWLQASYNPILGLDGKPYKIVKYASDVTEQVEMKNALDTAVHETQAVVQAAINGQLAERIAMTGKIGQIEALAVSVNALIDNMMKVVAEIKRAAAEVQNGAQEISKGNTHLSQRTEEQASSLEETASSMEEMTKTVKTTADNAARAQQLAVAASDQAQKGSSVVGAAVSAMNGINTASKKIADIIGVVDEIAFQTNLLALNAAVEAARAGEQGRGFAVVATEVRTLAGRSAAAAREIKDLISDSVAKVGEGSKLVEQSGHALGDIGTAVKHVTTVVAEIAQASEQQASGIEQVNKAVMQMDDMTQQNAALVEEAAAASQAIVGQATQLANLVDRYEVGAQPTRAARPLPTRPAATVARRSGKRPWSKGGGIADPKHPVTHIPSTARQAVAVGGDIEWVEF